MASGRGAAGPSWRRWALLVVALAFAGGALWLAVGERRPARPVVGARSDGAGQDGRAMVRAALRARAGAAAVTTPAQQAALVGANVRRDRGAATRPAVRPGRWRW